MDSRRSSVKIGMLPILMLVVALCLFALAVLALSTAHAAGIISDRQAQTTIEGYEVEAAGQHLVGLIDGELAGFGASGTEEAAYDLSQVLPGIASQVSALNEGISATAEVSGTQILATLEGPSGRHLEITLNLTSASSYQVQRWSLTTAQADEEGGDVLWTGM